MSENKLANPAPLGLMGFGMTTVLLNFHNAGFLDTQALGMVFGMGIFYGGLAQIIAGISEFKKGNTFGMTAFSSYGLFWLSLVALKVFPALGWAESVDPRSMGAYLTMWGLFTAWMFLSTLETNRALQFVFLSLAILFFLLALGDFLANPQITRFAGLEGIVCGFSAIYLAMAEVMNESYGKTILPIFPVKK